MTTSVSPPGPEAKDVISPVEENATFESTYACVLAFNDEADIAKVVRQAMAHCGNVIVCDDGSSDGTTAEARRAGANVIRHETSLGKGRSMSDLVNEVILRSPSGFVLVERGGFGHVADIPALLDPIMKGQADIAVGMTGRVGAEAADAGVTAMNSKGLFALYREGFFSGAGTSPEKAFAAAAGLRVTAITLGDNRSLRAAPRERGPSSSRPPSGRRRTLRSVIDRDFLSMGIPAIDFTTAGLWLLAGFLINYNYTGQIPVPQGVRGVMGVVSIIFGMAFMVAYVVVYSMKHTHEK
jgi:hypothetical protein